MYFSMYAGALLLLLLLALLAVAASVPHVEIAPGVYMPLVSNGACFVGDPSIKPGMDNESKALELWVNSGGRGIDTAWNYHNQLEVGWALGNLSASERADVFVTTKIPCVASAAVAVEYIKSDLSKLRTSQVDLVLIHSPGYGEDPQGQKAGCWGFSPCCSNASEMQATWQGLEQALALNLTRAIGVSNFRSSHINDLMAIATVRPAVNQAQMYVGRHDDAAIKLCASLGITYEAYSPLGPWHQPKPVLTDKIVAKIAKAHNMTSAMIGLRYIVQGGHPLVTASASLEYDKEDLEGIFSFTLTDEEMATLAAIVH